MGDHATLLGGLAVCIRCNSLPVPTAIWVFTEEVSQSASLNAAKIDRVTISTHFSSVANASISPSCEKRTIRTAELLDV